MSPVTVNTQVFIVSPSIISSTAKSTFQNLSSSLIMCWTKFFHISGVQWATPSTRSFLTSGSLNVELFDFTYLFTDDHANSIGFNSQWYEGVRITVIFVDFTNSSTTYFLYWGLIRLTISISRTLFSGP